MKASLVGRRGEAQAADYLRRRGYRIIEAGYRSRYGEIDLIAEKRGIVAIVEVKTRSGDRFAQALEVVDGPKRRRIRLTALQWLAQQEREPQLRFDVIEVYPGGKSIISKTPLSKAGGKGERSWPFIPSAISICRRRPASRWTCSAAYGGITGRKSSRVSAGWSRRT